MVSLDCCFYSYLYSCTVAWILCCIPTLLSSRANGYADLWTTGCHWKIERSSKRDRTRTWRGYACIWLLWWRQRNSIMIFQRRLIGCWRRETRSTIVFLALSNLTLIITAFGLHLSTSTKRKQISTVDTNTKTLRKEGPLKLWNAFLLYFARCSFFWNNAETLWMWTRLLRMRTRAMKSSSTSWLSFQLLWSKGREE